MPDTAPALTDEEIDAATFSIREHIEHCPTSWINEKDFDTWLAAVETRAARRQTAALRARLERAEKVARLADGWFLANDIGDDAWTRYRALRGALDKWRAS